MNNKRTREKAFPFTYEGWDEACGDFGDLQFTNVEFEEDFGPIKKGSKFECVVVYHSEAKLVCCINAPFDNEEGFAQQVDEIVVPFKVIPA